MDGKHSLNCLHAIVLASVLLSKLAIYTVQTYQFFLILYTTVHMAIIESETVHVLADITGYSCMAS